MAHLTFEKFVTIFKVSSKFLIFPLIVAVSHLYGKPNSLKLFLRKAIKAQSQTITQYQLLLLYQKSFLKLSFKTYSSI